MSTTAERRRLDGFCHRPDVQHVRQTRWNQRALDYCLTVFDDSPPNLDDERIIYGIYKQELAPTTLRAHWQVFVQCKAKTYPQTLMSLLRVPETSYIGAKNGTTEQAVAYCMKPDAHLKSEPVVKGNPVRLHENRGFRSDLKRLRDAVESTYDPRDLLNSDEQRLVKRHNGLVKKMYEEKHDAAPPASVSGYNLRPWHGEHASIDP